MSIRALHGQTPSTGGGQVDVVQKEHQRARLGLPAELTRLESRPPEPALVETLRQDAPAMRVAKQHPHLVAALVQEDEEAARTRILRHRRCCRGREAVERTPQISG